MIRTKIYLGLVFVLGIISILKGQEPAYDGYDIIPLVIFQDTVPNKFILRRFHKRIQSGKETKQDSVNYVESMKREPLLLIQTAQNSFAQKKLATQYLDNKEIAKYIGREQLLGVIDRIGSDSNHPKNLEKKGIKIISERLNYQTCHYFSSPFKIEENKYLIYHEKLVGIGNVGISQFLIYCYDKFGKVYVEKDFVLWSH